MKDGDARHASPALRSRVLLACVIATICAVLTWYQHSYFIAHGVAPDSLNLWRAANVLADGRNPWAGGALNTVPDIDGARMAEARVRLTEPLYYPLPAILFWIPLARLPFLVASTIFNMLATFLFVFAITREGLYRAWACGSVPFMIALRFGQWSPLIVVAWVYPWLSAFLLAKPNVGLPVYIARPSRAATIVCSLVLVLPTVVAPWWVRDWLHNIRNDMGQTTPHPVPLVMFGGAGCVLLLALLRWRRREARLLACLASLPQLPYWADQLPLMLIPRGRREMQGMMLVTLVGFVCWVQFGRSDPNRDTIDSIRPFSIVFTYVPALFLVLRRKNVGDLPPVFERFSVRLPSSIRGHAAGEALDEPGAKRAIS